MRQRSRWKIMWLLVLFQLTSTSWADGDVSRNRNAQKSLFSPRMDYNQWKPLGRGDPLKNDPTFDYVPPVLDHVHYWMDPEPQAPTKSRGENGHKTEILLLGVSSKKPALGQKQITASDRRDTIAYEPYPKYHQDKHYYNNNQRIARPNFFPSVTSQIIPSLKSLADQVFSKAQEPYTVLMPPPAERITTSPMTQKPFNTPSPGVGVTVEESNLIYQSSSLGKQEEFESVPSISWELHSSTEPSNGANYYQNLSPPKSFISMRFSPGNYSNQFLEVSDSNHNINYVTPPPLEDSQLTFKGHVSDDNVILNSYVKIEKPQAQMDHMGIEINNVNPFAHAFRVPSNFPPVSMQTIMDMETMKPPPVTQNPVYTGPTNPVASILKKEQVKPDLNLINYIGSSSSVNEAFVPSPKPESSSNVATLATESNTVIPDVQELSTVPPPSTTTEGMTTMQTLTTDPLFKHYKQPVEPMKGPLYLIIQGHSKVKTYKPAKQIDGIMVQETNEIPYYLNVDRSIKHLHGFEVKEDFLKKAEAISKLRQARTGNLQTLKHVAQVGLGAIDFEKQEAEIQARSDGDLEEAEVEVDFEVSDSDDVTTHKYHKGIVEEARKLHI